MKTRRILAGIVGATMALTMAGAVFAVDNNTQLTQTGTALDANDFLDSEEKCAEADLDPGQTLWHFVFTDDQDGISGHFAFSDGDQDLVSEDQGNIQAWNIITDNGVTLDGSNTWTDGTGAQFNLSHTCVSEAEETPSPTPTPTLPQTNTIGQTSGNGPGASLTVVFALILAVAGGLVAYAMRPRRVGNR